MLPTKILVATDFSAQAEVALGQAMNIARIAGAPLVLVHACSVVDSPSVLPERMHGALERYARLMRDNLSEARARLEQLRERISGQGVDVTQVVVDGFPDTGIRDAAQELGADLVVTGTHGRTGLGRLLLGSVAERVVRLCETNVLVARSRGDGGVDAGGGYRRILVPTDFSAQADAALDHAISLAHEGGKIDLVHFWQLPALSALYDDPPADRFSDARAILDAICDHAEELGKERVDRPSPRGLQVAFHAMQGAPTHGIHDRLDAEQYDLVVLGSHGRRGVRRLLLGSVAEATVRHANTNVLIVRTSAEEIADVG